MRDKLKRAICDFSMLENVDKVMVALSGGADSVALLNALNSIKEEYGFALYACHLNHKIRGDEADRDEQFCKELCEKLKIELFVKSLDVTALAKDRKQSLELCARYCRYEFFSELAEEISCLVATAHSASDNVETVVYNMTRGASINGMCGIKAVRDNIIRPLIYCTRADIERYCEDNHLSFVTDSTNLTDDYTRNNIRHNVVPVLKSINADVENAVSRMCATMTDIKDYLDQSSFEELKKAKTEYGYSCKKLLALNKAVLNNCITLILRKHTNDVSFCHIELIVQAMKEHGSVDLSKTLRCVCKQGVLRIVSNEAECDDAQSNDFTVPFLNSDVAEFVSEEEIKNINKKLLINCINCDIISCNTVLRTKKEGDTFTLKNRNVTKSLKKLLNELKIPAEKRTKLRVIANDSVVLWLEGVGVSRQGMVDGNSSGAYLIRL